MFKKIVGVVTGLCLVALITMGAHSTFSSLRLQLKADDTFAIQVRDTSGVTRFRVDITGAQHMYNSSGTELWDIDQYGNVNGSQVVVIDTIAELSTWSGAASGSSYFQMEAGKTYIVDPQKIYEATKVAGAGVTEVQGWSGVTAHLPLATATNNRRSVTVMWATTGSLAGGSGATMVQVWPGPLAGATMYRGSGAIGSQNMSGMATSGSSVVSVGVVGSYGIDAYGETGTWMLFNNSAVSAQMIDRDLP